MGSLTGLAKKEKKGGSMLLLSCGSISPLTGLENDARGKPGKRQVTVLASEAWSICCKELQKELPWTSRRANLLVSGIVLANTTGKFLHINNVILKITGETTPCNVMDRAYPGLQDTLIPNWRGGVTCSGIKGGSLVIGDEITIKTTGH